ncbi:hypothetical protein SNOG_03063 [Parastagonospora nodorum SN15]|uniref:Uncharacterized protein n=1 Tax=Phaeosphaeria nodorum (strain SN15 / ATCC MYA-4574 / FGSC 10173) TaxID=321614 RepID=Q0UYV1_PHANO|nr:hypothetical protein SNOG_03063 [Parastagonospora nodorum SN15]EAT89794.1 hypothetical protein SNOG_03063 [Parastagonospora nodorum SN15]
MSCMKERSTWLATSERSSVSVFIVTTRLVPRPHRSEPDCGIAQLAPEYP